MLGLVAGVVGGLLIGIAVAGYVVMISKLFGIDQYEEAQKYILLGSYAAWFAGFTFIATRATREGPFVAGFLASLPAPFVWLASVWHYT